jgi:hypothetical protein
MGPAAARSTRTVFLQARVLSPAREEPTSHMQIDESGSQGLTP